MTASNVNIYFDGSSLGEANTIRFNTPITVSLASGVANVVANTVKITELDSVSYAIGNNVIVVVTNVDSTPVTNRINISDLFGNISTPLSVSSNAVFTANVAVDNARFFVGNSSSNIVFTGALISIANSTGTANILPGLINVGSVSINSISVKSGNVTVNTDAIIIGNSLINSTSNSSTIKLLNGANALTLGSNSAKVGNTTDYVMVMQSNVIMANSTVTFVLVLPTLEQSNSDGFYLNSKGEWATVNTGIATAAGNNFNIQFNGSGSLDGADSFIFDKTSNTLTLRNGTFLIGNSTVNAIVNSTSFNIGSNVVFNDIGFAIGNATVNVVSNSTVLTISNSTGSANLTAFGLHSGGVVVNGTMVIVGDNVAINTSTILIDGTNSNVSITSDLILVGNSTSTAQFDRATIKLGTSTVNAVINTTAVLISNSTSNAKLTIPTAAQWAATNYFLHANGSWVTVPDPSAISAAGSNTNIQYNDSASIAGSDAFFFTKTTNTVTIANTLVFGNSTVNAVVNVSTIKFQNSTSNTKLSIPTAAERSGSYFLHANGEWVNIVTITSIGVFGANTQVQYNNSGSFGASAGFVFNYLSNTIFIGNTVANLVVNTSSIILANATSNTRLKIPTTVERSGNYYLHANGDWVLISLNSNTAPGGTNTNIQYNDSDSLNGSNSLTFDNTSNTLSVSNTILIGNSTVNGVVNSTMFKIANSTSNTRIAIPTTVQRSGSYYLHANGDWATVTAPGSNTFILFNDSGSLNAVASLRWDTASNTLTCNGTAQKPGGGTWSDSSDIRLKEDIYNTDPIFSWARIMSLVPVDFTWAEEKMFRPYRDHGFIAQDFEKIYPYSIGMDEKGFKTISMNFDFFADIVGAIKYLSKELDTVKQRIK